MEEQNPYAAPRAILEQEPLNVGGGGAEAALIGLVAPVCVAPLVWLAGTLRALAGASAGPDLGLVLAQVFGLMFYQVVIGGQVYRLLSRLMSAHPAVFALGGALPLAILAALGGLSAAISYLVIGAALGAATWLLLRWHGRRSG